MFGIATVLPLIHTWHVCRYSKRPCLFIINVSQCTNTRIDYTKLVEQFGTKLIDDALLERFERLTGQKPHRYLRRQIAFSHRDLEVILDT